MKNSRQLKSLCLWLVMSAPALAQFNESTNYSVGLPIPDHNPSGLASTITFSSSQIYEIMDLEVSLSLSGGFNGDYYAYLAHDTGFTVLLNRVGRDAGNPFGYPDTGMDVVLDDQAANGDIHSYRATLNPNGGMLTSIWAPDARTEDPASVLDGSTRSAFLDSFTGLDPNGGWTLFIADLDPASSGTLQSWGLNVTGIPEPSIAMLLLLGTGVLVYRTRCRIPSRPDGSGIRSL